MDPQATTSTSTPVPSGPAIGADLSWTEPFAVPVCILIGAISFFRIFKEPITRLIDRTEKGKAGPTGVQFDSPVNPTETTTTEETPVSEAVYEEKEEEKKKEFVPKTYDEWRTEMIIAALMKDKDRAEAAYQELLKLCPDPLTTKKSEITYWSWKHTLGETEAINHLKDFSKDPEVQFDAKLALGFCYNHSEDFASAALFYKEALAIAPNDGDKTRAADRYASALHSNGQKEEAERVLEKALSEVQGPEDKAYLYSELADLYEKEKDYERRAIVIEKALELKPNDTSLLFKAGYSYSMSRYEELSLFHYLNARKINPDDPSVRNNLGVQYDTLGMPFKSVSNYQAAAEQGETLALSNIAYRLMNAGFEGEAKERLDEAQAKENPHANVGQAVSDLTKRKDGEEEREKSVTKTALSMRKFILGFGDARYSAGTALSGATGDWKLEGSDLVFHIEVSDDEIKGSWKDKVFATSEYFWNYTFKGKVHNNSSEVKVRRDDKSHGEGRIFITADGSEIQFMSTGDFRKKEVLKLRRA